MPDVAHVGSMVSGGSGSSYILTESSYKPDEYMNGYNVSTYYFEHPYMSYITKQPPCVRIYKPVNVIQPDDLIKTFCHGRSEKITLNAGEYLLVCNGASGGIRDDDSGRNADFYWNCLVIRSKERIQDRRRGGGVQEKGALLSGQQVRCHLFRDQRWKDDHRLQ